MMCGFCGEHYSERMLNRHYTRCEDEGLAPVPTINDIKRNIEEGEADA